MCSNYRPVTRADRLLTFCGVERARDEPPVDIFPLGLAPFIRLARDGSGRRLCDDGVFGLLPHFATELAFGRRTYNARAETVATLPSFRHTWASGQRCIVPAECIFEPEWSSGRAVRWAIEQPGQVPMAIAGLYRSWRALDGRELLTFAMITVNADGHPLMRRFHRPGEEKRMVALLAEEDYGAWLGGSIEEARRLLQPWPRPLNAYPAPLSPRAASRQRAHAASAVGARRDARRAVRLVHATGGVAPVPAGPEARRTRGRVPAAHPARAGARRVADARRGHRHGCASRRARRGAGPRDGSHGSDGPGRRAASRALPQRAMAAPAAGGYNLLSRASPGPGGEGGGRLPEEEWSL